MDELERVYLRTESGAKALQTQDPALSAEHRQILGLIQGETRWEAMRKVLRRHADRLRLADLEADGLIVSKPA
jgi:hypothetical protein